MKQYLQAQLQRAVERLQQRYRWPMPPSVAVEVGRPKQAAHGDFASNIALVLASMQGVPPRELAHALQQTLEDPDGFIADIEIAGPGFLNFRLTGWAWQRSLSRIESPHFACPNLGCGKKVLLEYVSANPTGPLHVGNARGGPIGDSIARLLTQCGYDVTTEYYVNDVGGQVRRLGSSILHWMKVACGMPSELPEEGYYGEYVQELASRAAALAERDYLAMPAETAIELLATWGLRQMLKEIRHDCEAFGSSFDRWVLENDLRGEVETVIERLKESGAVEEREGALWFVPPSEPCEREGEAPSDKAEFTSAARRMEGATRAPIMSRESVLVRQTGEPTYFADDIVCHLRRYRDGFDRIINVWGANHHGHVPRLKAALAALGCDPKRLEVVLYQYVRVCRGPEVVKMSKRAGNYVTAREVLDEVGTDAMRFFLLQRAASAHLDFDLELAKKQSAENPIYYIQYAHARIASVQRVAGEKGLGEVLFADIDPTLLALPEELDLIKFLFVYPEEVETAARELAPHRIAFYLLELARKFHAYYSRAKGDLSYRVVSADIDRSRAKLYLLRVIKAVLADGLQLLDLTAPEEMKSPPEEVL